jgi:hypothetical protein
MEYSIGQKVKVKSYGELPESMKRRGGIPKVCGLQGEIVDKVYSEAKGCTIYRIYFDGARIASSAQFVDGSFDVIEDDPSPITYMHEFDYLENLVVARFYEVYEDGTQVEIAKGHGHIFHDGALGIAQAASYALKKLYQSMENNN